VERDAIIDNFRDGREKVERHCFLTSTQPTYMSQVLITANVIAHGIDTLQVNMVVNYGLPRMYERNSGGGGEGGHFDKPDIETYIHRIDDPLCISATSTLNGRRSNGSLRTPRYFY
jgi:ATP-dependent RNA helicase DDX19/DBP5